VHHIQLTNPFALREHAVNHLVEKIYFSLRLCEEVGVRNIILYLKVIEAIYYLWWNCKIRTRSQGLSHLAITFC
jgi:hypothetical protein